jgi:hypothetical protein
LSLMNALSTNKLEDQTSPPVLTDGSEIHLK